MHPRAIYFLCCHIPGSLLSIFYITVLVFLLKRRNNYGSSFYTLFLFGGVIDILTYLIVTIYTAPTSIPYIANLAGKIQRTEHSTEWISFSPYFSIIFSLTFFIPYSQDCLNLVISLNRFSAIAMPAKYRMIWSEFRIKAYIIIILAIAFILSLNTLGSAAFFFVVPTPGDTQQWYGLYAGESPLRITSNGLIAFVSVMVFNSAAMLMYFITAILLCKSKNSNGTELRLSIFGILLWLCSLPAVLYQLYFALGYANLDVITYAYPLVIMIKSLTPPLLLILTNPNLRVDFRNAITGRAQRANELSTVAATSSLPRIIDSRIISI